MNNLYNRIYEAVNNGIQKALIIDPVQDISVNWHKKKINADMAVMEGFVNDLLNSNNSKQCYEQILNLYINNNLRYDTADFEKICKIYNKLFFGRVLSDDMNFDWVNFTNVFIILKDGTEIKYNDFDNEKYDAEFIKITDNITGHDIIIHKALEASYKNAALIYWHPDRIPAEKEFNSSECILDKQQAMNDYNGYRHTYHNISYDIYSYTIDDWDDDNPDLFTYCLQLNQQYPQYESYIPALGELLFLKKYWLIIDIIMRKVVSSKWNEYPNLSNSWWKFDMDCGSIWSSTEVSYEETWILDGSVYECTKLPVYDTEDDRGNDVPFEDNSNEYVGIYFLPLFKQK